MAGAYFIRLFDNAALLLQITVISTVKRKSLPEGITFDPVIAKVADFYRSKYQAFIEA